VVQWYILEGFSRAVYSWASSTKRGWSCWIRGIARIKDMKMAKISWQLALLFSGKQGAMGSYLVLEPLGRIALLVEGEPYK
jgi:hypothetical protein